MKPRIDWNLAARNGLRVIKQGSAHVLIFTGKWMVWIGSFIHQFGKRLRPYSRPPQ